MLIGYARVSSEEQNLARQLKVLNEIGCEYIIEKKVVLIEIIGQHYIIY